VVIVTLVVKSLLYHIVRSKRSPFRLGIYLLFKLKCLLLIIVSMYTHCVLTVDSVELMIFLL